jgi:hypothetical protein
VYFQFCGLTDSALKELSGRSMDQGVSETCTSLKRSASPSTFDDQILINENENLKKIIIDLQANIAQLRNQLLDLQVSKINNTNGNGNCSHTVVHKNVGKKMVLDLQANIAQPQRQPLNHQVSNTNENKIVIHKKNDSNSGASSSTKRVELREGTSVKTVSKAYKPPPITACGVENLQHLINCLTRDETAGHEQQLKTNTNGDIKILTGDEQQFRRTINILEDNKIEYHRYQLKTEKNFRIVLRGLHPETDINQIKRDLTELGHSAIEVTNIQIKKKINPNDKNSEWKYIKLPLFFVDLKPQTNNKDIYNIENLCYHKIKVEPPKKKKEVPQCKNCQSFLHTQNYCHKKPVCVKCGEEHKTSNCPKPRKSKAKCANCGEAHTANWKGCSAYKKAEERVYQKKTTAVERIQQKIANKVTTDKTYAQMASTSSTHQVQQTKKPLQQQQENNTSLKEVLLALANITTILAKVTSRLDRLENNQSKATINTQKKKK